MDNKLTRALDELNLKAVESTYLAECFAKRYSTKPIIYSASNLNYSLRKFQLNAKVLYLLEQREKGATKQCLLVEGDRHSLYQTYLEAEVSVADILSEELLCPQ